MKSTKRMRAAVVAVAVACGVMGGSVPAAADDGLTEVADAIAQVPSEYGLLDEGVAPADTRRVAIPTDPTDGITLTSSLGLSLTVDVPFADTARDGVRVGDSLIYDNLNGSATVPLAKADGSVQIVTVIDTKEAPTRYEYQFPAGVELVQGEQSIAVLDADGAFLGGVAAPWAVDAEGTTVPTHYEVEGTTVVQVVDHAGAAFQYPIVADPWLGIDLYYAPSVTFPSGGYSINVQPTVWGGAYSGVEEVYMWWAHRDEVRTKLGSQSWRWTNTIQEQFYCHIAGFPAGLPIYNMESWRPFVYWESSLIYYQCNP